MSWFFFEVAKHPESQQRIREEIAAVRARSTSDEYSAADLDSMTYTQAALKVNASHGSRNMSASYRRLANT
jgi:hypothetical protein